MDWHPWLPGILLVVLWGFRPWRCCHTWARHHKWFFTSLHSNQLICSEWTCKHMTERYRADWLQRSENRVPYSPAYKNKPPLLHLLITQQSDLKRLVPKLNLSVCLCIQQRDTKCCGSTSSCHSSLKHYLSISRGATSGRGMGGGRNVFYPTKLLDHLSEVQERNSRVYLS